MSQTKINFNLKGLDELRKAVGNQYKARVGILGTDGARTDDSGLSNAELGVIQMFGSYAQKIPPRDFLLMPIQKNAKEILKGMQSAQVKAAIEQGQYKKVFKILGALAEGFVKEAFATGGWGQWAPNKPATIARKGSCAPLIESGQLRKAISSDVMTGSQAKASGEIKI